MHKLIWASLVGFMLGSCNSVTSRYQQEWDSAENEPPQPEERGFNSVDIRKAWRLQGQVLDVQRDNSRKQILVAAAQEGAALESLQPPRSSRVHTRATATAIYYDAFHDMFELVGDPVIHQGSQDTSRGGAAGRLWMYADGTVREKRPGEVQEAPTHTVMNDPE